MNLQVYDGLCKFWELGCLEWRIYTAFLAPSKCGRHICFVSRRQFPTRSNSEDRSGSKSAQPFIRDRALRPQTTRVKSQLARALSSLFWSDHLLLPPIRSRFRRRRSRQRNSNSIHPSMSSSRLGATRHATCVRASLIAVMDASVSLVLCIDRILFKYIVRRIPASKDSAARGFI